jgi:hypothetical protein
MAATKLQYSNNIDVGLVSHTHESILYKIYLHMHDHHPGQQLNLLFYVLQMFLHYLSIYIYIEREIHNHETMHMEDKNRILIHLVMNSDNSIPFEQALQYLV